MDKVQTSSDEGGKRSDVLFAIGGSNVPVGSYLQAHHTDLCFTPSLLVHSPQNQPGEVPAEPGRTTEEENLHYGEIDFRNRRTGPSSRPELDHGGQETVYAQVNTSQRASEPTQTAEGPEGLYAEVKRN